MRIGGLIRALGAVVRHSARWALTLITRLRSIAPYRPVRRPIWLALALAIWFAVISLNLSPSQPGRQWHGPVWNYANATIDAIYDYTNRSIREVIWNALNPTPCTTWTGPVYRTDGTPNYPPAPYNSPYPIPECWDCHGAAQWGFTTYTGMAYAGGAPVLHGK